MLIDARRELLNNAVLLLGSSCETSLLYFYGDSIACSKCVQQLMNDRKLHEELER